MRGGRQGGRRVARQPQGADQAVRRVRVGGRLPEDDSAGDEHHPDGEDRQPGGDDDDDGGDDDDDDDDDSSDDDHSYDFLLFCIDDLRQQWSVDQVTE